MNNNNIYITDEKIQRRVTSWPDLALIQAGCGILTGIDTHGGFHYDSLIYLRSGYWDDVVMTAMTWNCFGVVLGLKKDGTCVLGKDAFAGNASYYYLFNSTRMGNDLFSYLLAEVHSWHDIRQIMANDRFFAALDGSGRVHLCEFGWARGGSSRQLFLKAEEWTNVRQLLLMVPDLILAQDENDQLLAAGVEQDLRGNVGAQTLERLNGTRLAGAAGWYGGEGMHFAFLDNNGRVYGSYQERWDAIEEPIRQICGCDHTIAALTQSGRIIYLQDGFAGLTDNWPLMRQIALGKRSSAYDDLYLAGLS